MRITIFLVTVFLGWAQVAAAEGDADAGAAPAAACTACHNAMVSLKGRSAKTIAEQTKAIRAGDVKHPPGLAELSDKDIADIAAYLDTAD